MHGVPPNLLANALHCRLRLALLARMAEKHVLQALRREVVLLMMQGTEEVTEDDDSSEDTGIEGGSSLEPYMPQSKRLKVS